ncbi:60S ribosomal protein L34 [Tanacetum coccineum]
MRLTVNFHHDGNFVPSPLMYQEGEKSTIRDLEFEGMTVIRLSKLLQGTCMFPVKGIFFLIPGKELSNGLIEIKNDLDLANCIAVGYKNGKVVDMFLEHHGYDLSHWIQTDIDNNDDELSDVEMEDITGYGASDFVGEDDVVIPNRSINDPFLNKLCNGSYINDFTDDKSDGGESSQPSAKELEIDSDDEDVDKNFKLVDGVIYPEFDPKLPWNEMKPTLGLRFEHPEQLKECMTNYGVANGYQLWYRRNDYRSLFVLCGRELGEGRSGGKKGKKGDWPYKKEKNEGELPKKDKGMLLRSPTKGCRKVIGLDGCFLKGTCRGELLTAMGRDGNNQMFPIAWAVVSVETIDNWEWFLACLCEDIRLDFGASLTVISDGHKNGLHFKSLFWLAATTTIQHTFYSKMNLIGNIDPEAKQWLVDRNPNSWCRAFFKMDRGCAAYENGISESYHNAIRIARGKPLITMLEEIRVYLMQRLYSMHNLASNLIDNITPSIRKEIKPLKKAQRFWIVYPCGNNEYEIRNGDTSYGVNIENRTCACKWWDLSGVPCVHSVAAFSFLKMDPVLGGHNKKICKNKKQPQPTVEKRTPGRKKADSNFVFPTGGKNGCKNEKQPQPTVEKRTPGIKKADSNYGFRSW